MKRLICTLIYALAIIGINSCVGAGSGYYDQWGDNPGSGHHRGEKEDNNGGGNGGSTTTSVFPGDRTYKLMADAVYYGDQNYSGVDEFVLYLYWGEYDENNNFKTQGTELAFDVLCSKTGKMQLTPGSYSCVTDDYTPFHFLDGIEKDGDVLPSYAYYQNSTKDSKVVVISAGSMQISGSGTSTAIDVTFKAEAPDSKSAMTYKVRFNGEVAYFDGRSPESDVPKDVEMKSFSRAVAEYWGQIWEDDDKKTIPIDDWVLYLYGGNASQDSEYAAIEIFTKPGTKTLEPGIYNDMASLGHIDQFKPGAVLAGYTEGDDNTAYGTWYCKGGTAYYAATKGQLAIAVKDDLYSLSFDFIDEDEELGGSFKGSYTGKLEIVDKTVQTKSGDRRGHIMKCIAKTAKRRNNSAGRSRSGE